MEDEYETVRPADVLLLIQEYQEHKKTTTAPHTSAQTKNKPTFWSQLLVDSSM
eukprot:NODE_3328_length_786_cov_22.382632_g2782_i0.p1 GENE.NODE_3328_length_786_cov_22.382632_g2782_i0~~NODE_3328_length_786_cov_22.382632_g2782_i0.p1  ORF type:complete len:53 (+),score=2.22 NODE_3328_length_786_cov_22.382632_g2782_i0:89-247(+)